MADASDDGNGARGHGAGEPLVVEGHEVLEGTAATDEQDCVGLGLGRHSKGTNDAFRRAGALHLAASAENLDHGVAPAQRALHVIDDRARQARHDGHAHAEARNRTLARGLHEALSLELCAKLRHLLAQKALAGDRDLVRDETQAARPRIDVELAGELEQHAVTQLDAAARIDAAPDDDVHRRALVLDLEVAVAGTRVGAAESRDLACDEQGTHVVDALLCGADRKAHRKRLTARLGEARREVGPALSIRNVPGHTRPSHPRPSKAETGPANSLRPKYLPETGH